MVTAAALEGGDFIVLRAGRGADRQRRGTHPEAGRPPGRGLARGERLGCGSSASPPHYVHLDVLMCVLGERLAGVAVDAVVVARPLAGAEGRRDRAGLAGRRLRPRRQRRLPGRRPRPVDGASETLNERLRALGITVLDPDTIVIHPRRRRRALPDAGPRSASAWPDARLDPRRGDRRRDSTSSPAAPTAPAGSAGPTHGRRRATSSGRGWKSSAWSRSWTRPGTCGPRCRATPAKPWSWAHTSTRSLPGAGSTARSG